MYRSIIKVIKINKKIKKYYIANTDFSRYKTFIVKIDEGLQETIIPYRKKIYLEYFSCTMHTSGQG